MRGWLVPCTLLLALACKGKADPNMPSAGCEDSAAEGGDCDPDALAERCAGLDEQACGADSRCRAIEGRRVDAKGCLEEPSFTACTATGLVCSAAEVTMRHEDGSCWWFNSGCVPGEPWAKDGECREAIGDRATCGEP